MPYRFSHAFVSLFASVAIAAGIACAAEPEPAGSPYMRVVTADDRTLSLEMAVRTLSPIAHSGPIVHLVGAIHIGDQDYYDAMQAYLDVHDVVLYEGVGGPREPHALHVDGLQRALTENRLRFLGLMMWKAERITGQAPFDTDSLLGSFPNPVRELVDVALVDAWGNPISFIVSPDGFDAISFGADGKPGGTGDDADVVLSELLALERPAPPPSRGLQSDLASALGLVYQLHGINYTKPHWRNSDLSVAEIRAALSGRDAPTDIPDDSHNEQNGNQETTDAEQVAEALFGALSGESMIARTGGFLFKMLGSSQRGRAMMKIMLADMLQNADAVLDAQTGAIGDFMKVIIDDRNLAVVRDLRSIIDNEPDARSVAVFYGAGHFTDLERRILDDLSYSVETTLWIPAITVDLHQAGLTPDQLDGFRSMMRASLQRQMQRSR